MTRLGLLLLCTLPTLLQAQQVTTQMHGLSVHANLQLPQEHRADTPIFLIVHGTWAHYGMEIISTLQATLAERGYASLAPNLSLNVDQRTGFLQCRPTITANHGHAVGEINHWAKYLSGEGWNAIHLVGHSRGGAQAALFQHDIAHPAIMHLTLLAPMVFRPEDLARNYADNPTRLKGLIQDAANSSASRFGPVKLLNCHEVSTPPASFLSYYSALPNKHTPDILSDITIQTSVILAGDDEVARWLPEEINHANTQDNVQIHVIEDSGHFFRDLYLDDAVDILLPGSN
jgi:pimeloyl-ACP methyl ester carboxylesterase